MPGCHYPVEFSGWTVNCPLDKDQLYNFFYMFTLKDFTTDRLEPHYLIQGLVLSCEGVLAFGSGYFYNFINELIFLYIYCRLGRFCRQIKRFTSENFNRRFSSNDCHGGKKETLCKSKSAGKVALAQLHSDWLRMLHFC